MGGRGSGRKKAVTSEFSDATCPVRIATWEADITPSSEHEWSAVVPHGDAADQLRCKTAGVRSSSNCRFRSTSRFRFRFRFRFSFRFKFRFRCPSSVLHEFRASP